MLLSMNKRSSSHLDHVDIYPLRSSNQVLVQGNERCIVFEGAANEIRIVRIDAELCSDG